MFPAGLDPPGGLGVVRGQFGRGVGDEAAAQPVFGEVASEAKRRITARTAGSAGPGRDSSARRSGSRPSEYRSMAFRYSSRLLPKVA